MMLQMQYKSTFGVARVGTKGSRAALIVSASKPGELHVRRAAAVADKLATIVNGDQQVKTTGRTTLFDKLGGKGAMVVAADKFYQRVLADPTVNHFFANTDMKAQRAKQVKFLSYALGGAGRWNGRSMYDAHLGMHLTDAHFDAIGNHLKDTLEELGVQVDVVRGALEVVDSTRPDIVDT